MAKKLRYYIDKLNINSININCRLLNVDMSFKRCDKIAAWELYVEMVTRVLTQKIDDDSSVDSAALNSVYSIFELSRDILKKYGLQAKKFALLTILILNNVLRPFTSKWHRKYVGNELKDGQTSLEFREELRDIRSKLIIYTKILAEEAGVEDMTELNEEEVLRSIKTK